MSDLRGLSRGSKTAAVVVLVVLLQVIVVAVLGLGAISTDRDEGLRRVREQVDLSSLALARRVVTQSADELVGAIDGAARIALRTGGLRNAPRTGWLGAVREFYRVDADGRVRSAGGTLLYVPPEVIEASKGKADLAALHSFEKSLSGARSADPADLEIRRLYVTSFPFHTDQDNYARAVGEALQLAKDAAGSNGSSAAVADAVTLAYETAAINDRRPVATNPGFKYVLSELKTVIAGLAEPDRRALGDVLADLERARAGLAEFQDIVLPQAKEAAAHPARPRVMTITWGTGGDVVGLAPLARLAGATVGEALLVRFDRRTIAQLAASPATLPEGAAVRIVPRETPALTDGRVRIPLERPLFDPSLDVIVDRPGSTTTDVGGGPREAFYWFILGLATVGVSIAGVVLVRILRREVVLARLKADFVSNLSHELKTPLTSISMFTEMIREGRLTGEELKEGIAVISGESDRLQRIVSRMIDVARREAEGTGYELRVGDVNTAVRAACERFRRIETDAGLSLEVKLADALPAVLLDDGAIDDAVTNLLSNAWKYRRADTAHVRVTTRRAGRRVEICVEDDGIGIPKRERRRVFEMFYRAENYLSRNVPGTGLGLALVRTIVRVHRGSIRLDTSASGGCLFRLRFPIAKRSARKGAENVSVAPFAASPATAGRRAVPLPTPSVHTVPSADARTVGDRR